MFKVSIHAPLARSKKAAFKSSPAAHVSIHAPLARSKRTGLEPRRTVPRFNTCSSCEEQLESVNLAVDVPFQYMLLLRGATGAAETVVYFGSRFQYMLLLRGATPSVSTVTSELKVSIHAPLARSNFDENGKPCNVIAVSIHAPLARSNLF